jgi:hypothetical protein
MRRPLTALALVAAVLGVALVTYRGSQGGHGGPGLRVLTVGDLSTFRLPLDSYRLTRAEAATVSLARNHLFVGCMRRFGFHLELPSGGPVPVVGNDNRYGVHDEGQAGRHGYHPVRPVAQAREPSLSPAAEAVADGSGPPSYRGHRVPAGGCLGHALRTLNKGGPVPADPGLAERLALESYVRTSEAGPMLAVFASWSTCMRRAGFDYPDPRRANNDPAFRTRRPTSREVATAVTDARCKREVDLVDRWATVETAYQRQQVARYGPELEVLARALQTRVRNASRVTGSALR